MAVVLLDNGGGLPPLHIQDARLSLLELSYVKVLSEFEWDKDEQRWILECSISIKSSNTELVPDVTNWFVCLSPKYPWSVIRFYPASEGGLKFTFPHQSFNGKLYKNLKWFEGNPCLDNPSKAFDRKVIGDEPFGSSERLKWHFQRAQQWLTLASQQKLAVEGDAFEMPDFYCARISRRRLVFHENNETYDFWKNCEFEYGSFRYFHLFDDKSVQRKSDVLFVRDFFNSSDEKIFNYDWQNKFNEEDFIIRHSKGLWFKLPEIPVLEPWQAPATWEDLHIVFDKLGRNFSLEFQSLAKKVRNGEPVVLMLGFPIPNQLGELPSSIFWQAFVLPALSTGKNHARGFRANEDSYWMNDVRNVFSAIKMLPWIHSQNWDEGEIRSRGGFPVKMKDSKIAIIGAGAIGSILAELLVRNGAKNLVIIDDETVDIGNLSRHILSLDEVGLSKSEMVAERLTALSPHVVVESINNLFPLSDAFDNDKLDACDIIIDCTASDLVLTELNARKWRNEKLFYSISIGPLAKRIFVFHSKSKIFADELMRSKLSPWLIKQQSEGDLDAFPRGHTGCWHSVFPARADDLWTVCSVAVKYLEKVFNSTDKQETLTVFELGKDPLDYGYKVATI